MSDLAAFRRLGLVMIVATLVLDQLSKAAILGAFGLPGGFLLPGVEPAMAHRTVTSFFNIVLAWNPGVSFGMFAGAHDLMPWILSAVAIAISAVLLRWLWRAESAMAAAGLGMIVGGAIGNVIDRARFGAVVDFLDFHIAGYHWPAFNVADSGITVGVALLLIDSLRQGAATRKELQDGRRD
ncbi:MAG TPA: signal peptidase II [Alphaproteobacteria bacterium]|nr:signal peptidase II [Alphaproteobacteria bacterium]